MGDARLGYLVRECFRIICTYGQEQLLEIIVFIKLLTCKWKKQRKCIILLNSIGTR